jgi:hypothetical protein
VQNGLFERTEIGVPQGCEPCGAQSKHNKLRNSYRLFKNPNRFSSWLQSGNTSGVRSG